MKKTFTITIFFLLYIFFQANAAPAKKGLQTDILPDSTSISFFVYGDEKYHYVVSPDGYVLLKNEDGHYVYAEKDAKDYLVAGPIVAHDEENRTQEEVSYLKTISTFLEYHPEQIAIFLETNNKQTSKLKSKSFSILSGENTNPYAQKHKRNLVILVQFANLSFTESNVVTKFNNLLNQEGYNYNGATGSVRDYFIESSFGAYQPTFDVVGPYTLPQNMVYYVGNNRQMVIDACKKADDNGVDFSLYATNNDPYVDNVCIIYAGNNGADAGGARIWPHFDHLSNTNTMFDEKIIYNYICTSELKAKTKIPLISELCGIGTFTHEFSHLFDIPDLYNTDNSSVFCLDEWDIMDYGLYSNEGNTPPTFSAYERFYMGWLTPEILSASQANVTLPNLIDSNKAFIIAGSTPNMNGYKPSPNEFFLLENRQMEGSDAYLPNHGMLIWHINYNQSNWDKNTTNNYTPQRVYIVPADRIHSSMTKEGDPFPGTSGQTSYIPTLWDNSILNVSISDISEHNAVITFNFKNNSDVGYKPKKNNSISIWPANNTLYISGIEEKTQLKIIQADGKTIQVKTLTDSLNEIYIPETGIYIVQLASKNTTFSAKVVITKP